MNQPFVTKIIRLWMMTFPQILGLLGIINHETKNAETAEYDAAVLDSLQGGTSPVISWFIIPSN